MFISPDGLWNVTVIEDVSQAVLPPADFSIFASPQTNGSTEDLTKAIQNMPTASHVSLVVVRTPKGDPRDTYSVIRCTAGLSLLTVVSMTYDKPSRYSSVIMSPISETGFVLYKGQKPEISNTGWFQGESAHERGENATTHWDLTRYNTGKVAIEPAQQTTLGKFSWDMGLLMASLAGAPRFNRFIYGLDAADENLMAFVKAFQIECHVFTTSNDNATRLLAVYEKTKNPAETIRK